MVRKEVAAHSYEIETNSRQMIYCNHHHLRRASDNKQIAGVESNGQDMQ